MLISQLYKQNDNNWTEEFEVNNSHFFGCIFLWKAVGDDVGFEEKKRRRVCVKSRHDTRAGGVVGTKVYRWSKKGRG